MEQKNYEVDVLIFGGGVAGLWTLNKLSDEGYSCLLIERNKLGEGQTIASQGIIHGGAKYALPSVFRIDSSKEIREMPNIWRKHLRGELSPDLRGVEVTSENFYLWTSDNSFISWVKGIGFGLASRMVLTTMPERVYGRDVPEFLRETNSRVYRVSEPVLNMQSLLKTLGEKYSDRILYSSDDPKVGFDKRGLVESVNLENMIIRSETVILAAGKGNEALARSMGIGREIMQKRPLRQLIVRGDLPDIYAHNINGWRANASITTHRQEGKTYWNVGGDIAEKGASLDDSVSRLKELLPKVDLGHAKFSIYEVDRAEPINSGNRPGGVGIYQERNVIVTWPTKLALAPVLAEEIKKLVPVHKKDTNPHIGEELKVAGLPWGY